MKDRPIKVVFFHRRPRSHGNYSVEFVYNTVREHLPTGFVGVKSTATYESQGVWKRLYIAAEAIFRQGDVNHITGDVHFLASFLAKRRTILTVLDVGMMTHPSAFARWVLRLFWLTIPVKKSALVTTISQATKDELLKYVDCDPGKVKVVYVPISDSFKPHPKAFDKSKPTILQIGCAPNKNIGRLIEALRGIYCHLEVVGKLPPELKAKLEEYGISHHISWGLTAEEVRQKYIECDIVTLISTYEGFGMPIVEGNATGRVVISSNILSMPEVAGGAAHLVDPYEVGAIRAGLLHLIADDGYRAKLIEQGYVNRERFTSQKITLDYCKVYDLVYRANNKSGKLDERKKPDEQNKGSLLPP
jgi:glycosyltransferase involved in cell wall biosynthesis